MSYTFSKIQKEFIFTFSISYGSKLNRKNTGAGCLFIFLVNLCILCFLPIKFFIFFELILFLIIKKDWVFKNQREGRYVCSPSKCVVIFLEQITYNNLDFSYHSCKSVTRLKRLLKSNVQYPFKLCLVRDFVIQFLYSA